MTYWIVLLCGIFFEMLGIMSLKTNDHFTRLWPSLSTVFCYSVAIYLLSHALTHFPIGTVYAVWCGIGMIVIPIAGSILFRERLDSTTWIGIALVLAGVLVLNLHGAEHP
jgi:small multidrug resistance pump